MRKEMEEELARSLEQNRQEMTNMEMSWQQRLQESEQKIIIVRVYPLGGYLVISCCTTCVEGTGREEERRGS